MSVCLSVCLSVSLSAYVISLTVKQKQMNVTNLQTHTRTFNEAARPRLSRSILDRPMQRRFYSNALRCGVSESVGREWILFLNNRAVHYSNSIGLSLSAVYPCCLSICLLPLGQNINSVEIG